MDSYFRFRFRSLYASQNVPKGRTIHEASVVAEFLEPPNVYLNQMYFRPNASLSYESTGRPNWPELVKYYFELDATTDRPRILGDALSERVDPYAAFIGG